MTKKRIFAFFLYSFPYSPPRVLLWLDNTKSNNELNSFFWSHIWQGRLFYFIYFLFLNFGYLFRHWVWRCYVYMHAWVLLCVRFSFFPRFVLPRFFRPPQIRGRCSFLLIPWACWRFLFFYFVNFSSSRVASLSDFQKTSVCVLFVCLCVGHVCGVWLFPRTEV